MHDPKTLVRVPADAAIKAVAGSLSMNLVHTVKGNGNESVELIYIYSDIYSQLNVKENCRREISSANKEVKTTELD